MLTNTICDCCVLGVSNGNQMSNIPISGNSIQRNNNIRKENINHHNTHQSFVLNRYLIEVKSNLSRISPQFILVLPSQDNNIHRTVIKKKLSKNSKVINDHCPKPFFK
jgi:hypothetical protein